MMSRKPIVPALLTGSWEEFYHGYANESLSVYYVKDTRDGFWLLFAYYFTDEVAPTEKFYGVPYDEVSLQEGENRISGLKFDKKDSHFALSPGSEAKQSEFCRLEIKYGDEDELTIHCTIEDQRFRLEQTHLGKPKIFEHYVIDLPDEDQ